MTLEHVIYVIVKIGFVNIISSGVAQDWWTDFWVWLNGSERSSLGIIPSLAPSSLALFPCSASQLSWTEYHHSDIPFCQDVSALEPPELNLSSLKAWVLDSFFSGMRKLVNIENW